jgi:integrase
LADITPFLIEKYKRLRKEAGRSEVTINRELAFLKNLFTMAVKWGKASENPVAQMRFFREENGRTRFLTENEETRLLASCNPFLRPLVVTALHTGFRKSELLSLRWGQVDFRHRLVTVDAAYAKNGETRSVPMTAMLYNTLRPLQAGATIPVFLTHNGTPYQHIAKVFEATCRRAGLTDVTFHDLRHTFASRLVMAGVDLPTVQALMGHKRIDMTLRYTHLAPGHKRTAITVLDRTQEKVPPIFTTGQKTYSGEFLQVIER